MHELLYTVDINGCIDIDTVSVEVHSLPAAGFTTAPDSLCINSGMATLQAYPAGASVTGTGVVPGGYDPAVGGPGNHWIRVDYTDPFGCSVSDSNLVHVFDIPTPTLSMPDSVCSVDGRIGLVGSPAGGTFLGTNVVGDSLIVSNSGTNTIEYEVFNSFGCSDTATQTIYVGIIPQVSLSPQAPMCTYDMPQTLFGSPSGGIYSGPGVTGALFDPASAGPGTHIINYMYVDAAGCQNSATTSITVWPEPVAQIQTLPDSLCSTDASWSLQATSDTTSLVDGIRPPY